MGGSNNRSRPRVLLAKTKSQVPRVSKADKGCEVSLSSRLLHNIIVIIAKVCFFTWFRKKYSYLMLKLYIIVIIAKVCFLTWFRKILFLFNTKIVIKLSIASAVTN